MEQPITPPRMIIVSAVVVMFGWGVGNRCSGLGLEGGVHISRISNHHEGMTAKGKGASS